MREFLRSVTSIPATCISKACDLNIRRELKCAAAGKQYFPRWEKGKGQQKVNCCVPSCNLDVHVTKHQFSWQVICAALGIASVSEGELDLPLCAPHYQLCLQTL